MMNKKAASDYFMAFMSALAFMTVFSLLVIYITQPDISQKSNEQRQEIKQQEKTKEILKKYLDHQLTNKETSTYIIENINNPSLEKTKEFNKKTQEYFNKKLPQNGESQWKIKIYKTKQNQKTKLASQGYGRCKNPSRETIVQTAFLPHPEENIIRIQFICQPVDKISSTPP